MFLIVLCRNYLTDPLVLCDINPINMQWRRRYEEVGDFECEIDETEYERILSKNSNILKNFQNIGLINTNTSEFGFVLKFVYNIADNKKTITISGSLGEFFLFEQEAHNGMLGSPCPPLTALVYLISVYNESSQKTFPIPVTRSITVSQSISSLLVQDTTTYEWREAGEYERGTLIYEYLKEEEAGISAIFSNNKLVLTLYRGDDKSNVCIFSEKLNTIRQCSYSFDSSDYKSSIIGHAWSDTYYGMTKTATNTQDPSGLNLYFETHQEQSDLDDSKFTSRTSAETEILRQAELCALNHRIVENISITPNLNKYTYLTDYDLGDKVQVRLDEIGVSTTPRITGINETYKNGHMELELVLGDSKIKHF